MPGASCAWRARFAVELLNPKPMSCSWLALTPLTRFGAAVLVCERSCTCEVNDAPKSSLKPLNSAPGSLVVSNTLRPRLSCGRMYCIEIGRPFVQDSLIAVSRSAASLSASLAAGSDGEAARSDEHTSELQSPCHL